MLSNTPIEDLCRKLRPILGDQIEKVYMKYSMSTDRDERLEVEKLVHALYHKHLGGSLLNEGIMLEPPQKEVIDGEYRLGTIRYADNDLYPFAMREKDWIRHMCITGMSGSGKTTFAYTILGAMMLKKKPFLVFDWKRSFRPLLNAQDKTMVFTIGNENVKNFFKTNLNIPPPGVGPKQWITILADLISESYSTSFGVHKVITEVLHKAFQDFKVYEGSGNYPNWFQIKDRLHKKEKELEEKKSSREYEWVTSALRVIHSLTFGSFGEVINYKGSELIDLSELMNHQIVFELDSLANTEKKFFTSYVLTYIYKYLKSDPNNLTSTFRHLILVDEAHNIFLKDKSSFVEEPITEAIFREVREFGESLVCLDQHVSKLSDVISGNSACNIAFQQQLPEDIRDVSELMQLSDRRDDRRKYFGMLPVGHAIVKLAERYHNPFLIKAPFIDVKKKNLNDKAVEKEMETRIRFVKRMKVFMNSVEDDTLKQKMKEMEGVFYTSGVGDAHKTPEFLDYQTKKKEWQSKRRGIHNHLQRDLIIIITSLIDKGYDLKKIKQVLAKKDYKLGNMNVAISNLSYDKYVQSQQNELKNKGSAYMIKHLSRDQMAAMEQISQHTYTVTELYRTLQVSARKGNDLKKNLETLGLIEIVEEKSPKGMKKKIVLTVKGNEMLKNAGIPVM